MLFGHIFTCSGSWFIITVLMQEGEFAAVLKHHALNTYGEMALKLHALLTLSDRT